MTEGNKPKLRKLKLLIALLLFSAVLLEVGSFLYFRVTQGAFLSNLEILEREPGSFVRKDAEPGCSYRDGLFPHPYLAWVRNANPPCGWDRISAQGLYGPDIPPNREHGVFRILLTGGSVGVQLGFVPVEHSLETLLNQRFGNDQLRFEVINGALEAWKQPQHLFLSMMHSGSVDGIVSLEGFNEFFSILTESEAMRRMDLPWKPSYVATNPYFEQSGASQVASWANQRLYEFSGMHWLGSRSKFVLLTTRVTRGRFAAWAAEQEKDWSEIPTSLESLFESGLLDEGVSEQWNLDLYKRYLRLMNAFSEEEGIQLAIFIQPSPAIHKEISEAEKLVVGDLSYGADYEAMTTELLGLKEVPIFSLLNIYENEEGQIYSDPVHQPVDGPGYRIMVEQIIRRLKQEWNLVPSSK